MAGTNGSAPTPFHAPVDSKSFSHDDEDVVVVVGSGAGGGTIANELCQQGVRVVVLEAGPHLTGADYVNDEWPAFNQMAWLDPRTTSGSWRVAKDFPNLPAWTVKAVGGTTTHWAGACPRFKEYEFRAKSRVRRRRRRRQPPRLADRPLRDGAVLRQGRGQDGRHARPGPAATAREQQLHGARERRRPDRLHAVLDRPLRHERRALRRAPGLRPGRVQLPGRQARREVVDADHRAAQGGQDGQPRPAPGLPGGPDHAQRRRQGRRRPLRRRRRQPAAPARQGRRDRRQRDRDRAAPAAAARRRCTPTGWATPPARSGATTCAT